MEQCCFTHHNRQADHPCTRCGHAYCIDCLTVVDHKPICQKCARRVRIPSEREAIAAILISSIAMAAAVAIYTGAYLAIAHSVWG
jgi:hypothetical protein